MEDAQGQQIRQHMQRAVGSGLNSTSAPPANREIERQVVAIRLCLDLLEAAIDQTSVRLSTVLCPPTPSSGSSPQLPKTIRLTILGQTLADSHERLTQLVHRLDELTQRIEL